MKRGSNKLVFALVGVVALSASVKAHADTETFTATIGVDQTDFTDFLHLKKFDPSKGVLQSVQLSYVVQTTMNGTVTNNAKKSQTFKVTDNVTATLLNINANASATQTFTNLATHGSATFGTFTNSGSANVTYTTPADFTPFVGTGTTNIQVDTSANETIIGGGGNILASLDTEAGGMATVIYTYAPIPEASTLLGFGALLGMGAIRLRRRAAKA